MKVLTALIRLYQRWVSPLFAPRCRFYPTCSEYAAQALERHGPLKGGCMAAWRILRCGPWSAGGVDEVPKRRERRRSAGTESRAVGATPVEHTE